MSQKEQSKLDRFFKVKHIVSAPTTTLMPGNKKRLNLSLSRTPMKSPKLLLEDHSVPAVIDLTSDDEMRDADELNCSGTSATSNSSNTTITYSPAYNTSPGTPKLLSPSPKKKFYSPSKKRQLAIKSPVKAKRNLSLSLGSQDVKDEEFKEKTKGVDDKTIFLMKIVNECLNDRNLRLLISEKSLELFEKYMQAKPPGQRIVCRLYWQVEQWCRWNKIKNNACGNKEKKEKKEKQERTNIDSKVDIDDPVIQDVLNYLIENGFIAVAQYNGEKHDLNFDEMVKIVSREELEEICKGFKIKEKNKAKGIQLLKNFMQQKTNIASYFGGRSNNESRLLKVLGAKAGKCYKLADQARQALNELYILMYLGMNYSIISDKNLEQMLLNEKSQRESYPVDVELLDNASVVFKNRLEFERYLNAHSIYGDFLAKTELKERCRIIESVFGLFKAIDNDEMMTYKSLPVWLRRFTPAYIFVKILGEGITDLKRDKTKATLIHDILSALIEQNVFRQHKKAHWIAEKALVLDKFLGDADQAAKVLLEGFSSNLPTEAEQLLYPRALRLAKRKTNKIDVVTADKIAVYAQKVANWEKEISARHIYKVPMDNYGKGKLKFEAIVDGARTKLSVEEYCIHHYIHVDSMYTHGGHWEGRIVTTFFFLLFWDIIYARLRGVRGLFLSRYQAHPLDLYTDSFYANRQLLIEDRLKEIEKSTEGDMLARMQATWDNRPETEISGINRSIGWDNVSAVAACLGPRRVAVLCRRLATRYHYAHSGFPDLTLWNVHTKQIVFVEVKTDSDKPSMKQMQWMHYLKDNKINVEFCYVGVHTKSARSRNCGEMEYSEDDADD
ncbi:fanconi-associated nuclease 1-like isoform X2 [Maniola jurtina]|uniref:fanconi-associated nuclease 1-like isoform X2 n=1 Tax=Maniola jurtina TaxID=191418 RepID=UPI001E68C8BE|nr:fanconi-associated nuclease 1-like isoform X2 [Maniola jurtina]